MAAFASLAIWANRLAYSLRCWYATRLASSGVYFRGRPGPLCGSMPFFLRNSCVVLFFFFVIGEASPPSRRFAIVAMMALLYRNIFFLLGLAT